MKEANPAPPEDELSAKPASLSPGMATLLKVKDNGTTPAEPQPASISPPVSDPAAAPAPIPTATATSAPEAATNTSTWQGLVQGSLVLADLLLVAMAAWLVFKTHGPLGIGGALLCVLAFGVGAWMSCLALGWPRK